MNELIEIQSKLKAPKNQYNSFGKYRYRNCEDILEAVKPLLKEHNCFLTISDSIQSECNRVYVRAQATITNSKGDTISVMGVAREAENKKGMDDSQITGSTSSYARKYALNGLFAIDDTKDADSDKNPEQNKKDEWTEYISRPYVINYAKKSGIDPKYITNEQERHQFANQAEKENK